MADTRKSLLLQGKNLAEIAEVIYTLQGTGSYSVVDGDPVVKDGTVVADGKTVTFTGGTDLFEVVKFDISKELGEKVYSIVINFNGDIA